MTDISICIPESLNTNIILPAIGLQNTHLEDCFE